MNLQSKCTCLGMDMNNVHVSNIKTIEMTTMNEWIKNFSFYFEEMTHVFHSKFIIQHRYRIACFSLSKSFPFNQIAGMSVKEYFISMDNDFVKNCIHPAHIHTHIQLYKCRKLALETRTLKMMNTSSKSSNKKQCASL